MSVLHQLHFIGKLEKRQWCNVAFITEKQPKTTLNFIKKNYFKL